MKFSESWLREWVNPEINTADLAEKLTMAGLEVDSIEPVAGEFSGVVVAKIVSFEKHPDADKLNLCQIDAGDGELLSIICGAPNVREGMMVACAKIGAVLPGDFKIKKAKLRGVESFGMLCSAKELGLSEEHGGIMDLDANLEIGTDIRDALNLNDVAIDVDLTPNRGDCLGIRGIAREVGVLTQTQVNEPEVAAVAPSIDDKLNIEVSAAKACPRYLGRIVKGVNAKAKTPQWMLQKLERSGVRPINPVVDVTNYVLLELGHPMHAFDLAQIDSQIHVRMAEQGEKFTLLDGNQVELNDNTLMIADASKALAIAGVMGGENSGVTDDTQDILLESAFFAPLAVAGIARSYGLHTDASHRYERGVDPELQHQAMERATQLVIEICGGSAGPVVEVANQDALPTPASIELRKQRLVDLVGFDFEDSVIEDVLTRLGMQLTANDKGWTVVAPTYRFDISIEEDLIEELVRVYGYNNIPVIKPKAELTMTARPEVRVTADSLKDTLVNIGYQEAITYSFVAPEWQKAFYGSEGLKLLNPISADLSVMRQGLWAGLAHAAKHNLNRQQSRIRLFETGLKFELQNGELKQTQVIGGLICGSKKPLQWSETSESVDFYDIKGDVENLLEKFGILQSVAFVASEHQALHSGQAAAVVIDGVTLGYVGAIHPKVASELSLPTKLYLFELDMAVFAGRQLPQFAPLSKFPTTKRDLALVMPEEFAAAKLMAAIKQHGGDLLQNIELFDVYQGDNIEKGQKSIALGLTYGDQYRNLKDEEINNAVDQLLISLKNSYSVLLRE